MRSTRKYNAFLDRYHFFKTENEARAYAKSRRWKKYLISNNEKGDCWTLVHDIKNY